MSSGSRWITGAVISVTLFWLGLTPYTRAYSTLQSDQWKITIRPHFRYEAPVGTFNPLSPQESVTTATNPSTFPVSESVQDSLMVESLQSGSTNTESPVIISAPQQSRNNKARDEFLNVIDAPSASSIPIRHHQVTAVTNQSRVAQQSSHYWAIPTIYKTHQIAEKKRPERRSIPGTQKNLKINPERFAVKAEFTPLFQGINTVLWIQNIRYTIDSIQNLYFFILFFYEKMVGLFMAIA